MLFKKQVWAGAMVWHAKALDTNYDKRSSISGALMLERES